MEHLPADLKHNENSVSAWEAQAMRDRGTIWGLVAASCFSVASLVAGCVAIWMQLGNA
jgi:hypothetical protein